MPNLVPIPWQPTLYLTPHTLGYLVEASDTYGSELEVEAPDGAWREYAQQLKYYEAWLAYLAGHGPKVPVAANPDTGQRNHMRGAAFDLVLTTARAQAACKAVGLIRDSVEGWHWNDPAWASMPIIVSRTTTAGDGSTPLDNTTARRKGNTMSQVIYLPAFPAMLDTDPRIVKIKSYVGGAGLTNFTPKAGIYALVGDSPGTLANVQVSQSDARANEWAADHTGSLPSPQYKVSQGARAYKTLDEFLALCDAYLSSAK